MAFITWVVSAHDLIGQFLQLAFQKIFAGVNGIRHGGSEESIDAVRRQASKWVTDCFTQSADFSERPESDKVFPRQASQRTPERTAVSSKV